MAPLLQSNIYLAVIRLDLESSIQFVLTKRWITRYIWSTLQKKVSWRVILFFVCLKNRLSVSHPWNFWIFSLCNGFHNHPQWKEAWLLPFAGDSPGHVYYTDGNEWGSLLRDCVSFEISTSSHFTGCHDCKHLHLDWYVTQYHYHDLS